MRKTVNRTKQRRNRSARTATAPVTAPFIVHFRELRRRLSFVLIAIGMGAALAYLVQAQLTTWLLRPAGGQQFIYTTPGGGFDFQFKLCLFAGLALGIPVIVYHLGRYLQPLLRTESRRFVRSLMIASSLLAFIGIGFGYFVGLPAAMHFLLQSFSGDRISALITIQSYMSFVMVYLLGSALLFQIPLVMILINRLKPLQPARLFFSQKWLILGAFVAGAIISPTPDIRNQLLLTGPIIFTYELSIALIWLINRRQRRSRHLAALLQKDEEARIKRLTSFNKAHAIWLQSVQHKQPSHEVRATAVTPQSISQKVMQPSNMLTPPATQKPQSQSNIAPVRRVRVRVPVRTSNIIHPSNYIQDFSRRRTLSRTPLQAQSD